MPKSKAEWAAYMREYRAHRPEKHAKDKRQFKLHRQAEQILRRRHSDEFRLIYEELLRTAHIDGRIAESSASPPGSQASQQNTEPSIRRDANASDAEAGLGSTGPGEDPSRAGRAGTPPPAHRDGSDDA